MRRIEGVGVMKDVIFIGAVLIFFAVTIFYVYGCERLK